MVLVLVSLLLPSVHAGVWVGTPVGVRLADTEGHTLAGGGLAASEVRLVSCAGTVTTLPLGPIDTVDPSADLQVPAGCWTELRIPVDAVAVDTFGPGGEALVSLVGFEIKVSLGNGPPAGVQLTLVVGSVGWLSPVDPWLGPEVLYVDAASPLHDPLLSGLAEAAILH